MQMKAGARASRRQMRSREQGANGQAVWSAATVNRFYSRLLCFRYLAPTRVLSHANRKERGQLSGQSAGLMTGRSRVRVPAEQREN